MRQLISYGGEMIFEYLFLLLIGHVLGDFYFQSEKIAKVKDKKYSGVLRHSVEYLCVMSAMILPIFSWEILLGR